MTIVNIACLAMVLSLFVFALQILAESQAKLAMEHRLQVCALQVIDRSAALVRRIRNTNRSMNPLREIVYAARSLRLVPGAAAVVATVAERTALYGLKALKLSQDIAISQNQFENARLQICRATKFSATVALCQTPKLSLESTVRKKTLYTDVPGDLVFRRPLTSIFHAKCSALKHRSNSFAASAALVGDNLLRKNDLGYAYQ